MKHIEYTLPEFAFLDGSSAIGDTLEGRTIIQHIRSYTVVEAIALEDIALSDFTQPIHQFTHYNALGMQENHMLVLHFSMSDESELSDIFEKISIWYCDYMTWEDKNISSDEEGKHN